MITYSSPKVEMLCDQMRVTGGRMAISDYLKKYDGKQFIKLLVRIPKVNLAEVGPDATGVYFLMKDDEIVYVGQTVNLKARLNSHHIRQSKYDMVRFIGDVPIELLDYVEGYYIHKAKPKYNVNYPFIACGALS